jgi:alpha-1,6-mannosyltransferase
MPQDLTQSQAPVVLASGAAAGAAPRTLGVERPSWWRLPRLAFLQRPLAARLALHSMLLGTFVVVAFACSSQSLLVPGGYLAFPPWESGPLHAVFRWLPMDQNAMKDLLTAVLIMMLAAWGVALKGLRTLPMRAIVATIIALHVIVVFSPPLQLNDVWNYLGYARLGAVHHLSPYTHVIRDELHDPVFRFSSWHNLSSPYGPLFTAVSYPLALLPLPVAYWIVKIGTMLASLGLIALIYRCARQLGRDPRFALVFVALNPIYIIYAMGGFHNDFFMLIPMLGAISLVLSGRDRSAGAVLMLAVAIKFTAVLLLPFLLVGVRQRRRQRDVVAGSLLAAVPLAAMSLALFGPHLPNLADQSTLLTPFSISNLGGLLIGAGGGAPWVLTLAKVALVVCVAWLLYRRRDWISSAGWGTVALIASLAWLMPWYVIWVLPLAALGTSLRLRRAAVVLTVFLIATFMPLAGNIFYGNGINPLNTKVGHASYALQKRLAR